MSKSQDLMKHLILEDRCYRACRSIWRTFLASIISEDWLKDLGQIETYSIHTISHLEARFYYLARSFYIRFKYSDSSGYLEYGVVAGGRRRLVKAYKFDKLGNCEGDVGLTYVGESRALHLKTLFAIKDLESEAGDMGQWFFGRVVITYEALANFGVPIVHLELARAIVFSWNQERQEITVHPKGEAGVAATTVRWDDIREAIGDVSEVPCGVSHIDHHDAIAVKFRAQEQTRFTVERDDKGRIRQVGLLDHAGYRHLV